MRAEQLLSDRELAAIEQRAAAATPGPWVAWLESRQATGGCSFIRLDADPDEDDERYLTRVTGGREIRGIDARTDADIDFIAAARQDVPCLLDAVRRLRAALEQAQSSG
ncbi:hypothetical protein ACI1MP_05895 [Kitasatospora griseola]|uniref:hypothetical protein n=1 Tax=Kitasatospora griseola TaxID=2064 RepID=UPI0038560765